MPKKWSNWYRILNVHQLKQLNEMPADSSVVALQNEAHPRMTWPSYKVDKKNIDIAITTHQFSDKRLCINHNFPVLKHWSQSSVQSNF
jgi:hypothetical protein